MNRWRSAWLLLAVWFVALFGPAHSVLLAGRELAFRDAGHFYRPYLQFVHRAWADDVPLWNHQEERGRPLAADPTAAVFYPGNLLFRLPLRFDLLWPLYLLAHVAIAAFGGYRAARQWQLSRESAALASLGYAFGGQVIFQVHNLPYLIGAAWLPWTLAGLVRLLQKPCRSTVASVAGPLALIVLGGDLQTAYLVGLASLFAWVSFVRKAPDRPQSDRAHGQPLRTLAFLAASLTLASALSAIQWLPTWHWSQQSSRWQGVHGTRLSAPVGSLSRSDADAAGDNGFEATAARQRYDYSVGPWRWLELCIPNASGLWMPSQTRWTSALASESRAWSPSLYMGLPVAGLALLAMRRPREADWQCRWLWWLTFFGVAGSLGRYGLSWWLTGGGDGNPALDARGGLYWVLSEFLPGFRLFRYPAKLWTWTACAASLLAAHELQRWLDELVADARRTSSSTPGDRTEAAAANRLQVALLLVIALYAIVLGTLAMPRGWLAQTAPADAVFGPFDADAFRLLLVSSTLHAVVVCLAWWVWQRRSRHHPLRAGWALVALTAVDLSIAHRDLIPTVPAGTQPPALASLGESSPAANHLARYLRVPDGIWYPSAWTSQTASERLREVVRWDGATLRPKYHLDERLCSLRSSTSFSSTAHLGLLALLDQLFSARDPAWLQVVQAVGCRSLVMRAEDNWAGLPVQSNTAAFPEVRVATVPAPFPRAWVVYQRRVTESAAEESTAVASPGSVAAWQRRLHEHWILAAHLAQFRTKVFVEDTTASQHEAAAGGSTPREFDRGGSTTCEVLRQSARFLELRVRTERPGWLVLNDSYDAGWQATVSQEGNGWSTPVDRANDIMMSIAIPAGDSVVSWSYHPAGYESGKFVSLAAWLLFAVIAVRSQRLR